MGLLSQKSVSHQLEMTVKASSEAEAISKAKALSEISSISLKSLQWLAKVSKKPGIEKKLEMAKKFV